MVEIERLEQLSPSKKKVVYKYKNLDFMADFQPCPVLVVMFHAKINNYQQLPVFRGYDYQFPNATVLSLSDPLPRFYQNKADNVYLGWYLETKNVRFYQNFDRLLDYVIKKFGYQEIIFVSQCSGSLFAYKMASKYQAIVVFTNPHLVLSSDVFTYQWHSTRIKNGYLFDPNSAKLVIENGKPVPSLKTVLEDHDDSIHDENELDVRNFKKPKRILGFVHREDYTFEQFQILDQHLESDHEIQIHSTKIKDKHPHHTHFPNEYDMKSYLKELIETLASSDKTA